MRAEPFHQQWFVLLTHEKHSSQNVRSNTRIVCLCWKTANENSKHPKVIANKIATVENSWSRA